MKHIPENRQDIKELLYKQLALLEEKSKQCALAELCEVSRTMLEISLALCSGI